LIASIICINACTRKEAASVPALEESSQAQSNKEAAVVVEESSQEQIPVEDKSDSELLELWEKHINNDFLYPFGKYFWDEFGDIKEQYSLSEEESELLGFWIGVDNGPIPSHDYYFYPNKLFAIDFELGYSFIENKRKRVEMAFGVWHIEDNVVKARIYGYKTIILTGHPDDLKPEFFMVRPYEIDIINLRYYVSLGFFTEYFNDFVLPIELEDRIIASDKAKITYMMARLIYIVKVINPGNDYRYLDIVPEVAKENLSGMDIVTNRELLEKYFSKARW
jgi:hypothetical protein